MPGSDTLDVRYNRRAGALFVVIGIAMVGGFFANEVASEDGIDPNPLWFIGIMIFLVGLVFLMGRELTISSRQVKHSAPLSRSVPIKGYADLELDGLSLRRVSDGRGIHRLSGLLANRRDIEKLRRRIEDARDSQRQP